MVIGWCLWEHITRECVCVSVYYRCVVWSDATLRSWSWESFTSRPPLPSWGAFKHHTSRSLCDRAHTPYSLEALCGFAHFREEMRCSIGGWPPA